MLLIRVLDLVLFIVVYFVVSRGLLDLLPLSAKTRINKKAENIMQGLLQVH